MKITTQRGKGEKLHIYANDVYRATTTVDFWYSHDISEGSDLTEEQFLSLLDEVNTRRMYDKALSLLTVRDYAKKELSDKLVRKELERPDRKTGNRKTGDRDFGATDASFSTEELQTEKPGLDLLRERAEEVCARLGELGLLNDERFARNYAAELHRNRHLSERGIRLELQKKGIDRETVETVVTGMNLDPVEDIRSLLGTKYKSRDFSDEKQRRRTVNALLRMGFRYDDVERCVGKSAQESRE